MVRVTVGLEYPVRYRYQVSISIPVDGEEASWVLRESGMFHRIDLDFENQITQPVSPDELYSLNRNRCTLFIHSLATCIHVPKFFVVLVKRVALNLFTNYPTPLVRMVPIVHVQQRLAQYFMHNLSDAKQRTTKKQQQTKSVEPPCPPPNYHHNRHPHVPPNDECTPLCGVGKRNTDNPPPME